MCMYACLCVCVRVYEREKEESERARERRTEEWERRWNDEKGDEKKRTKGASARECERQDKREIGREVGRERGEKVPNTRKTRAPYFCKSGFIRKARVVRRDVELPELPILYKKTFTAREEMRTPRYTHIFTLILHTYT